MSPLDSRLSSGGKRSTPDRFTTVLGQESPGVRVGLGDVGVCSSVSSSRAQTVMVTVIVSMTLDALIGRCILYFSSVAPLSLGSYHLVNFSFQMCCPAVEKTLSIGALEAGIIRRSQATGARDG